MLTEEQCKNLLSHADDMDACGWKDDAKSLRELLAAHNAGATMEAVQLSRAEQDVIAERRRQVEVEGWKPEHDDELDTGTLASAAMSYIAFAADLLHPMSQGDGFRDAEGKPPMWWPFDASWWKPTTPRRALEKGVALALAEIEHIDRAAEAKRSRAR